MNQTSSDYIRRHGLVRKYALGFGVIALAALASVINGDSASSTTLKMMLAIPFAVSWAWLPTIFDPVRSRTPFTPSFIERTILEGLLLALAVVAANWTEDYTPLRMIVTVATTTGVYFGIYAAAYGWFIPKSRK